MEEMSLEELCRVCLRIGRTMCSLSLVESIVPKFDSPSNSVVDLWNIFNKVLITDEDRFRICIECYDEIQRTYFFVQKCERSEDTLTKMKNGEISLKRLETISVLYEDDSPKNIKSENDIYSNISQTENIGWIDDTNDGYDEEDTESEQFTEIIYATVDSQADPGSEHALIVQSEADHLEIERLDYLDCENNVTNDDVSAIKQEPEHISAENDEFDEIESDDDPNTEIFICLGVGCCFECRTKESLEEHLIANHIEEQMCKVCNKEFFCTPIEHCSTHLHVNTTETVLKSTNKKQYKCKICSKIFEMKCRLNEHLRIHTGERPFMCEFCSKTFRRKSDLTHHLRSHTGERPYKCEICLKEFRQKIHLTQHERSHTGERPFQCEICRKAFQHKKDLTRHFRSHTGERSFKCEICTKSFRQKIHLTQHLSCHTGERPFQCGLCPKTFRRKNDITRHLLCHTGKRIYECEICPKTFQRQIFLTHHLKFHIDERPFKCESCPKDFRLKNDLTRHLRCHSDERPFKCESCLKAFRHKKNLTRHLRCHMEV